ncbi:MAG TPA: hypothetical protein VFR44_04235 [Actinomycetota bacterium]|nr:hypothetical protein [Actinomycetota bacterium]
MPNSRVAAVALTRRSLIAAGTAGLLLSGCAASDGGADPATRSDRPEPTPSLAPDVAVATTALAEIRATAAAVAATAARFPDLPGLAALSSMHRAHEASLVEAVPERARSSAAPTPYAVPQRRPLAQRRLAAGEQRLHDTLDALALRAQSGDFARLLAAMGAGIAVRLGDLG